jgi:hypothetical protein
VIPLVCSIIHVGGDIYSGDSYDPDPG